MEGERVTICGRVVPEIMKELNSYSNSESKTLKWNVVYVGNTDIYEQYLALTFPPANHYSYIPSEKSLASTGANVKRALMRRHFAIEKTKDATRIGILVGTLGVSKYRDIIDKCRDSIKRAGKRPYTFLVG